MTTTIADLIIATLKQIDVRRIYGVVGDSLNGITGLAPEGRLDRVDAYAQRRGGGVRRER